jgi:polar amino acid transport system substrate-binding protein
MMLDADGTPTGAGPEIDRAVLREIGVTSVRAQVMSYGSMIPALQAHRVTLASGNGLIIKPARCASILFSEPVICSGEAFLVPRRLFGTLRRYHDLVTHDIRVGVCGGCLQQTHALDAGVRPERITVFSDEVNGLKMLLQGRIDALAIDSATVISVQKRAENPDLTGVVPIVDIPQACAAAAFVDPALRDAYSAGLRRIRQTGEYQQILKRFDLEAFAVTEGTATTAELCR